MTSFKKELDDVLSVICEDELTDDVSSDESTTKDVETSLNPKIYLCFVSLVMALFIAALDVLIVIIVIGDVTKEFAAPSKTGWMITGYSLPKALFCLIFGRIASIFGLKFSMLASIAIFEAGSLITAIASSMNMLIIGRVISGIGGSGIQTLCFIIATSLVSEQQRGMAVSILSSAFAISSIAGPFMGGVLATHVSWRWCFYINLPIGGVAFIVFLFVYNSHDEKSTVWIKKLTKLNYKKLLSKEFYINIYDTLVFKLDIGQFILSSSGLTLLLLAITFGGHEFAWSSGVLVSMFVVGGLLTLLSLLYDFVVLPRFERMKSNPLNQPLLPWHIISKSGVISVNLYGFLTSAAFGGQISYIIQYFQLIHGKTPWEASVRAISSIVPTVFTVMLCGIIESRTGYVYPLIILGACLGVMGSGLLTLLTNETKSSAHIGLLILPGVAYGAATQTALISSQLQIKKSDPQFNVNFVSVTAFNAFMKSLGMAFGGVLSNMVFDISVFNKSKNFDFPAGLSGTSLITYRLTHFDNATSRLGELLSKSIINVFYLSLGLSALAFFFGVCSSSKKVLKDKTTKASVNNDDTDKV